MSNEGIVMSERDFDIDNALVELIELAMCGNQAAAIDLANTIDEEYNKALEHCKQGEPVAVVKDAGNFGKLIDLLPGANALNVGDKLFAHAMPKSDSAINELVEAVDDVLEKAPCDCSHKMRYENGEHLSSCYLFDLNIASLKANSTPQPTTDISELRKQVEMVRDLKKTQCTPGNYNYSPYMLGMANALILAMSVFDGGRPEYLDAPKVWGEDLPMPEKSEIDGGTQLSPSTP